MFDLAYAMGTGGGAGQGGGLGAFLPLIIIFAIFYFLLIRPQQRKAKLHKLEPPLPGKPRSAKHIFVRKSPRAWRYRKAVSRYSQSEAG